MASIRVALTHATGYFLQPHTHCLPYGLHVQFPFQPLWDVQTLGQINWAYVLSCIWRDGTSRAQHGAETDKVATAAIKNTFTSVSPAEAGATPAKLSRTLSRTRRDRLENFAGIPRVARYRTAIVDERAKIASGHKQSSERDPHLSVYEYTT